MCESVIPLSLGIFGGPGLEFVGRNSVVGIAIRYRLDGPGIEYQWGARYSAPVQTGPGAHSVSYRMGTGSFPGVKRPERSITTHL